MSSLTTTTEGPQPPGSGSGLAAAFLVAFLLHAGALGALALWRAGAPTPGENEITIDLAPAPGEVSEPNEARQVEDVPPPAEVIADKPPEEPTAPPVETQTQTPTEVQHTELQTAPLDEPEETPAETAPPETVTEAVPLPEEQVITSTNALAPVAPPPPAVVAREVKPQETPKPPKVVRKPPPPKPVKEVKHEKPKPAAARERSVTERQERRTTAYASRQESAGAAAASSNEPNLLRAWGSMITSTIRSRVRHSGVGGTVSIRFTVSKSGRVLSASLAGSSGNGALDAAALAATSGSMPPAPEGVTRAQQSFSVPLRFQ
ncbi:energy transducer TonB family protein [Methylobacterium oryzihabitans]|uniref:TonB family protein n=1 Tax=Methylobacterium oryzihabitans TaxID=2499852 RepID=A0A3S2V9A2_9HYPH|nr:energy transducer TonB [Methylobacterium oryzihabitans]RVU17102.1 TonB family protein [Methylobacterium oryzihabitans]